MFLEQDDIDLIANRLRISNMCQSRLTWGYLYAIQVCDYIIQRDIRLCKPPTGLIRELTPSEM